MKKPQMTEEQKKAYDSGARAAANIPWDIQLLNGLNKVQKEAYIKGFDEFWDSL